ncbi:MAG: hypothetical protein D6776_08720 [Planctomycetota bacterium]|nr:MAG: hypothetical protein D6776_08720 [Planctomycetota bacterium]
MVRMIEINLLPPQYRTVERTPLPVFLGLIVGLLLIGAAFVAYVVQTKRGVTLAQQKRGLELDIQEKKAKAAQVDRIQREIKEARMRIDAATRVAQERTPWTRVLSEFVDLRPPYIWLESQAARRGADGKGELRLACNARGTNLQRYTEFRQRLRSRTNFMYHFSTISGARLDVRLTGEQYLEPKMLSFNLTLPLAKVESH